jgi:hypothetical protein
MSRREGRRRTKSVEGYVFLRRFVVFGALVSGVALWFYALLNLMATGK